MALQALHLGWIDWLMALPALRIGTVGGGLPSRTLGPQSDGRMAFSGFLSSLAGGSRSLTRPTQEKWETEGAS